jgi:hypothetical protein
MGHLCDVVCFLAKWEDHGQDDHEADPVRGGPYGTLGLTQARLNFLSCGAYDQEIPAEEDPSQKFYPQVRATRLFTLFSTDNRFVRARLQCCGARRRVKRPQSHFVFRQTA